MAIISVLRHACFQTSCLFLLLLAPFPLDSPFTIMFQEWPRGRPGWLLTSSLQRSLCPSSVAPLSVGSTFSQGRLPLFSPDPKADGNYSINITHPPCESTLHLLFCPPFHCWTLSSSPFQTSRIFLYENTKIKPSWCCVSNRFKCHLWSQSNREVGDLKWRPSSWEFRWRRLCYIIRWVCTRWNWQLCVWDGRVLVRVGAGRKADPREESCPHMAVSWGLLCVWFGLFGLVSFCDVYIFREHTWSFHLGLPLS